jgi:hypothetical protein
MPKYPALQATTLCFAAPAMPAATVKFTVVKDGPDTQAYEARFLPAASRQQSLRQFFNQPRNPP